MKDRIQEKLTIRAKLKSFDYAEVVIMSVETGEIQVEEIPILIGRAFPQESETVKAKRRKKTKNATQPGESYDDDSNEAE